MHRHYQRNPSPPSLPLGSSQREFLAGELKKGGVGADGSCKAAVALGTPPWQLLPPSMQLFQPLHAVTLTAGFRRCGCGHSSTGCLCSSVHNRHLCPSEFLFALSSCWALTFAMSSRLAVLLLWPPVEGRKATEKFPEAAKLSFHYSISNCQTTWASFSVAMAKWPEKGNLQGERVHFSSQFHSIGAGMAWGVSWGPTTAAT